MTLPSEILATVNNAVAKIKGQIQTDIETHSNELGSSSSTGHTKAGGAPQDINITGTSSAGTDNGYYARADHVHKIATASTSSKGIVQLDNTPTTNSTNAITSGAVQSALSTMETGTGTTISSSINTHNTDSSAHSTAMSLKADKANGANQITDTTSTFSNLGTLTDYKQSTINQAIDEALEGKASSTHNHTKSQITDFPSIPSKTSDLTNDSNFLTSHQSLKTINNQTITGTGNITIDTGAQITQTVTNGDTTHTPSGDAVYDHVDDNIGDINDFLDSNLSNITNEITDNITNNDMRAVTSNAVYDAIHNLNTSIDLVTLVTESQLPTASLSTLNKLYVKPKNNGTTNDNYDIYITIQSVVDGNNMYSWEKIDNVDLQSLTVDWSSITNKPTLSTVATSGSYNDLSNKPITQTVTNGDTTHAPSGDAVYDYIDNIVGDIHTIIYGTGGN